MRVWVASCRFETDRDRVLANKNTEELQVTPTRLGRQDDSDTLDDDALDGDALDDDIVGELVFLLRLWPWEIAEAQGKSATDWLSVVRTALRNERRRGLAGHWTYDLSRHWKLFGVYRRLKAARSTTVVSSMDTHCTPATAQKDTCSQAVRADLF